MVLYGMVPEKIAADQCANFSGASFQPGIFFFKQTDCVPFGTRNLKRPTMYCGLNIVKKKEPLAGIARGDFES
jgi:hypothetical protein